MAYIRAGQGGSGGDIVIENVSFTGQYGYYGTRFGVPLKNLKEFKIVSANTSAPWAYIALYNTSNQKIKNCAVTDSNNGVAHYTEAMIEADLVNYPNAIVSTLIDGGTSARSFVLEKMVITNRG